jgi:hypothetical protein
MAGVVRIPRRRGGLCGLLLILLGAWGALIPFIGPYFKFAYTPDQAWAYTSGRLYLSVLPGAAAVLGGLLVLATRSRTVGMFGGLLAAVGGAWFIAGAGIVKTVLKQPSISPGIAVSHGSAAVGSTSVWTFLEGIGFFVGVGALVIFFGAIAVGRFSMLSARDAASADSDDYEDYSDSGEQVPATSTSQFSAPAAGRFPASPSPFPSEEPTQTQARFPAATEQSPSTQSTPSTQSSPSGQFPESTSPFGGRKE